MSPNEVADSLNSAEQLLFDMDDIGFRNRMNEVTGVIVPCASQPLTVEFSAQYHRLVAIHLYSLGDNEQASSAIAAAKYTVPDYNFDDSILGGDHPLREEFDAVEAEAKPWRKVPEPKIGSFAFDGTIGRQRPKGVPTLVQRIDETGTVTATQYLAPREPLPDYEAIPRTRNALLVLTGFSALTSGTLYGVALKQRSDLLDAAADQSVLATDLDGRRARLGATNAVASSMLFIALGTGGAAALVGER